MGHVTALYDADACARHRSRFVQTLATGDTSCLGVSPSTASFSASPSESRTRRRRR